MTCPHKNITHCPLYHAAHHGGGIGCDDGQLGSGECAVARGMNYSDEVAKLLVRDARLVAQLEWDKQAEDQMAQRRRNLAINGIH